MTMQPNARLEHDHFWITAKQSTTGTPFQYCALAGCGANRLPSAAAAELLTGLDEAKTRPPDAFEISLRAALIEVQRLTAENLTLRNQCVRYAEQLDLDWLDKHDRDDALTHAELDAVRRTLAEAEKLADELDATEPARDLCNDFGHDDRWCGRCNALLDGLGMAAQRLRVVLDQTEKEKQQ